MENPRHKTCFPVITEQKLLLKENKLGGKSPLCTVGNVGSLVMWPHGHEGRGWARGRISFSEGRAEQENMKYGWAGCKVWDPCFTVTHTHTHSWALGDSGGLAKGLAELHWSFPHTHTHIFSSALVSRRRGSYVCVCVCVWGGGGVSVKSGGLRFLFFIYQEVMELLQTSCCLDSQPCVCDPVWACKTEPCGAAGRTCYLTMFCSG